MKKLWMVLTFTPLCIAQEFEDAASRTAGDEEEIIIDIQPEETARVSETREPIRREDIQRIVAKLLKDKRSAASRAPGRVSIPYTNIVRALGTASKSEEFKDSLDNVIESLRDSFAILVSKINEVLSDTDRQTLLNLLTRFGTILERVKENPALLQQRAITDPEILEDMNYLRLEFLTKVLPALSVLQLQEAKQSKAMQTKHFRKTAEFFLDVVQDAQEILGRSEGDED